MPETLTSQKIYKVIESEWPVNLTQIARELGYEFENKEKLQVRGSVLLKKGVNQC